MMSELTEYEKMQQSFEKVIQDTVDDGMPVVVTNFVAGLEFCSADGTKSMLLMKHEDSSLWDTLGIITYLHTAYSKEVGGVYDDE